MWPLLVLIGFPFRTRRIAILVAAASLILLLPPTGARSYGGLFLGALFGILLDKSSGRLIRNTVAKVPAALALAAVIATYLLVGHEPSLILLFSLATSFFTAALVTHQGFVRRLLEHPVMVLFGKRSYAMYLVHIVLLDGIEVAARRIHLDLWYVVVPMAYLASFAAAMALFYVIERPAIAHGRELSRQMRKRISGAQQFRAEAAGSGVAVIEREEVGVPRAF
jgi:peptidoglycan/LPS O-acetylase OafA/YrhL